MGCDAYMAFWEELSSGGRFFTGKCTVAFSGAEFSEKNVRGGRFAREKFSGVDNIAS